MDGMTNRMAAFAAAVSLDTVPQGVVTTAQTAILDCLGVTLAAADEALATVLRNYVAEQGARPVSTAGGLGLRTSPELAALAGGAMAHALDYDDVSDPLYGHPSVVLVPAVLAAAEATGASGRRVLEGYIAGFEVAAALGRALNPHHYSLGWHATSTLGAFGAAAAVSRVLGLSAAQTATALGIAASLAGGIRRNFGSMTKPFHAGSAARAGVVAASLAKHGLTAADQIVEGEYGFAQLYHGSVPEALGAKVAVLGERWSLAEDGIWFKYYPCCASTHRSIDAVLTLMAQHRFGAADVEGIVSRVPAHIPQILIHPRPRTALQGKFSLQYCVSAALLDGAITMATFTDSQVARPEAQALGERIRMEVVEAVGETTEVVVTLKDGRRLTETVVNPKGHPRNPLTPAEVEAKFRSCAAVYPGARPEPALAALRSLAQAPQVSALMADLHGR